MSTLNKEDEVPGTSSNGSGSEEEEAPTLHNSSADILAYMEENVGNFFITTFYLLCFIHLYKHFIHFFYYLLINI